MFALGIWDRHEKRLLLARDRLGVKPLYYAQRDGMVLFASCPQALFAYDPRLSTDIDLSGLSLYLEAGYFPAPFTLHSVVRKLPAGHLLEFGGGKTSISAYWNPLGIEPIAAWRKRPEGDLLDELDALLTASVKARLISDVPLGAFLSGGIDSSLVVALMSKVASGPVKTFTIGFREPQYDESVHAAALSEEDPLKAFRFMRSIAKDFGGVLLERSARLDDVFAATVAQMPESLTPAEQAMRLDLAHILPEEYLQKTDLSSMTFAL